MTLDTPRPFSLIPMPADAADLPEPAAGPYYVATKTGYMLHQNFHWGRVLTPAKEAAALAEGGEFLWHDVTIPEELISRAWGFFRQVWERDKSEAMVDITWNRDRGYRLFVPPQAASMGGVACIRTPEHYKGLLVGTIHSHCNFGAFHSGTDTHDADGHDGLHMTIGHVDSDKLDIAIMISVDKIRWDLKLDQIVEDPNALHPASPPPWWINQMKKSLPGATEGFKTKDTPKPSGLVGGNNYPITTYHNPVQRLPDLPPRMRNHLPYTYHSLDALIDSLSATDPRRDAIEEAQQMLDVAQYELDQLGIDLDYEVAEAVTGPLFAEDDYPIMQAWRLLSD